MISTLLKESKKKKMLWQVRHLTYYHSQAQLADRVPLKQ